MKRFVMLQLLGAGATVAIDPQYVVHAQEFDSGRGPGVTLKLVSGDAVNVRGTLAEVLDGLTRPE
ncbi:MAG TPA: hypothetical protein VGD79_03420 [Thermoanaerobaculia bacterium]|jgi:hypothetical protein